MAQPIPALDALEALISTVENLDDHDMDVNPKLVEKNDQARLALAKLRAVVDAANKLTLLSLAGYSSSELMDHRNNPNGSKLSRSVALSDALHALNSTEPGSTGKGTR